MKILKLSLALTAAAAFSQAAPITYNVNLSIVSNGVTPVTLVGSITTDGTIGQIQRSNVLSFSLTTTYNSSSLLFSSAQSFNNYIFLGNYSSTLPTGAGNGVLASSTRLTMLSNSFFLVGGNPDAGNDGFYFGSPNSGGTAPFRGRSQNAIASVNIGLGNNGVSVGGPPFDIGAAPAIGGGGGNAVPEPSTMCLMGLGLGAAWLTHRKRHANR